MSKPVTISEIKITQSPFSEKEIFVANMHYVDCEKENCALWVKAITTDPGSGLIKIIRQAGCAIKRLAEK